MPLRARTDLRGPAHTRFDDANGVEVAGVDDHAVRDLGLPEKRMPLAAHRDLKSVAVCELHELRDVLRIAWPKHGGRLLMHDGCEVRGRLLPHGLLKLQPATA